MNLFSRIGLTLILSVPTAAYGESDSSYDPAARTLAELVSCMRSFDAECVTSRTYAEFFKRNGVNPKKAARALLDLYSRLKADGAKYSEFTLGDAQNQTPNGRSLYVIVPYSSVLELAGRKIQQEAFFIGVSEDAGETWKFLDGISTTQENIRKVIPNYSGAPLPARRMRPLSE